ncbi:MAG: hypothetical protein QOG71_3686 [Pyrinomonadaceae bacterium]|nr:hypothetical protein [Pyrinomonadaceae bacterium]
MSGERKPMNALPTARMHVAKGTDKSTQENIK